MRVYCIGTRIFLDVREDMFLWMCVYVYIDKYGGGGNIRN